MDSIFSPRHQKKAVICAHQLPEVEMYLSSGNAKFDRQIGIITSNGYFQLYHIKANAIKYEYSIQTCERKIIKARAI